MYVIYANTSSSINVYPLMHKCDLSFLSIGSLLRDSQGNQMVSANHTWGLHIHTSLNIHKCVLASTQILLHIYTIKNIHTRYSCSAWDPLKDSQGKYQKLNLFKEVCT